MNTIVALQKQMEVDFLKTKTYEEINDMFNQLHDKLKVAERLAVEKCDYTLSLTSKELA